MFYLYLKQHNVTNKCYLGQTTKDPFKYKGSGTYWLRHISKHGNDVTTVILAECETREELRTIGLYYSSLWNIVESVVFANLMEETGDGSGKISEQTRQKLSAMKRGISPSIEVRKKISKALSGRKLSEQTRQKLSGRKLSPETKANMIKYRIGKKLSEETRTKISNALSGRIFSEDTKRKMSESQLGRIHSEESKRKMSESQKNKIVTDETRMKMKQSHLNNPTVCCPHCQQEGKGNTMKRWHFDNCKIVQ